MSSNHGEVVTARPFRSVKEAVAVFGECLAAGDKLESNPNPIYAAISPQPSFSSSYSSSSQFNEDKEDELMIVNSLKKFEAELESVKRELMLMKERDIETETLVASLNEELKKSMSKLSAIEEKGGVQSERLRENKDIGREMSSEYWPALAQALSLGVVEGGYCERKRKAKIIKKKPIVPLLGDMFFKKKEKDDDHKTFKNAH